MASNKHPISKEIRQHSKALRTNQTDAEKRLWSVLRNRNLNNLKFRRQHPIGKYIVDFICMEKMLVIEIDGDSHAGQEMYDSKRTEWLEAQGYKVIRFTNEDVQKRLDAVAAEIIWVCEDLGMTDR